MSDSDLRRFHRRLYLGIGRANHRIPARFLIATRRQRVQGQRIGIGDGVLFFDQHAQDARLEQRKGGKGHRNREVSKAAGHFHHRPVAAIVAARKLSRPHSIPAASASRCRPEHLRKTMANPTEVTNMALFCDFENVALGVQDAKYERFDIGKVLERLLLKGSIVVKKAYCDWERYKAFKAAMHEASFELIEIPHVRQSGKNSADIRMVVDALDLCYTKSHVETFVIISGDSDFSPLVSQAAREQQGA